MLSWKFLCDYKKEREIMFDINFFMNSHELRKQIMAGKKFRTTDEQEDLFLQLEQYRSKTPVVFNIETTNLCNMRCGFCPRTTLMTRKNERMGLPMFEKVVDQLAPHSHLLWKRWESFLQHEYNLYPNEMNQDHFFFYIIPKVLTLHGFGEPLLDKDIAQKVKLCTERGIPTYFSCNPHNVTLDKAQELFLNGLDYIKFSIDSIDDTPIRGRKDKFSDNLKKIEALAEMEKPDYTKIVVTMIKLDNRNNEQWHKFEKQFKDMGVYVYLKDQDQVWHDGSKMNNQSIDWNQFCCSPWYSMTIKSNGDCVGCQEDYNNQIVFGNANDKNLLDIWNNKMYNSFRMRHVTSSAAFACKRKCDKKTVGEYVR